MDIEFESFCPESNSEKERIWKEGIIILDTNVLLNTYRYSKDTRNEFFQLLENKEIKNKLWIPYQVALEFHKNRPLVIASQKDPHQKITSIINKNFLKINEEIDKIDIHKHHPFIDIHDIKKLIKKSKNKVLKSLNKNEKKHPVLITEDEHLIRIQKIFKSKYGKKPSIEELEKLVEEGKERYKNKIPPGFMDDETKEGNEKYGDFILWYQILQMAEKDKKDVVFVTDDNKKDWWLQTKGMTIGARPELKKEFTDKTSKRILLYNSASFFKNAQEVISVKSSEKSLIETQEFLEHQLRLAEEKKRITLMKKLVKPRRPRPPRRPIPPTVENMVKWFYENFDDPANGVPYDSGEGGYQYVFGGPYDPRDELNNKFLAASDNDIEKASNEIYQNGGDEWVRKGEY